MTRQEIDKIIDGIWYFGKEVVRENGKTYVMFDGDRIPVDDWMDGGCWTTRSVAYVMRDLARICYDKGFEEGKQRQGQI